MNAPLPAVAGARNPHFERIGGREAVVRLVDAFYGAMDTRADARAIRAMHEPDLARTKSVLVCYLVEWLGGARDYSALHGAPALRRRHLRFAIDASARDAWLACMQDALRATGVNAALRDELQAAFAKIAAHLRNTDQPEKE